MNVEPRRLRTADTDADGMIAIGYFNAVCRDELGDRLVAYTRGGRAVEVGASDLVYAALLPAVRTGQVALAVLPASPAPDLCSAPLWTDTVAVALPVGHRLADTDEVPMAALCDEHFLISRQQHGADLHRYLARRIGALDTLRGALLDASASALFDRVAAGEGLSLLCGRQAARLDAGVVVRPVAGPASSFEVRAFWREGDRESALEPLVAALGQAPR